MWTDEEHTVVFLKLTFLLSSSCSFLRSVKLCWRPARTTSLSGNIKLSHLFCFMFINHKFIIHITTRIIKHFGLLSLHRCVCSFIVKRAWSRCVNHLILMSRGKERRLHGFMFNWVYVNIRERETSRRARTSLDHIPDIDISLEDHFHWSLNLPSYVYNNNKIFKLWEFKSKIFTILQISYFSAHWLPPLVFIHFCST